MIRAIYWVFSALIFGSATMSSASELDFVASEDTPKILIDHLSRHDAVKISSRLDARFNPPNYTDAQLQEIHAVTGLEAKDIYRQVISMTWKQEWVCHGTSYRYVITPIKPPDYMDSRIATQTVCVTPERIEYLTVFRNKDRKAGSIRSEHKLDFDWQVDIAAGLRRLNSDGPLAGEIADLEFEVSNPSAEKVIVRHERPDIAGYYDEWTFQQDRFVNYRSGVLAGGVVSEWSPQYDEDGNMIGCKMRAYDASLPEADRQNIWDINFTDFQVVHLSAEESSQSLAMIWPANTSIYDHRFQTHAEVEREGPISDEEIFEQVRWRERAINEALERAKAIKDKQ